MSLTDDPRPPLPEWITAAYTVILAYITESKGSEIHGQIPGMSRKQAVNVLCTSDELALEPVDAEHAITRLIKRGYFYEVDAEFRVTTPSEEW